MSQDSTPTIELALDAQALYEKMRQGLAPLLELQTCLVGIHSGGLWIAERLQGDLQQDLKREVRTGAISSVLHRDDFGQRGLAGSGQTNLPFEIEGADVMLLDDVLYTGRTLRAVINELFDYGRPARVRLAVLVDRGGRQLPVCADWAATKITLAQNQLLALDRLSDGRFTFRIDEVGK